MEIKAKHPAVWLTVLFIVLKVTGVIDWSWWLVTLPFWGCCALAAVLLGIARVLK